ncbi:hypothetical protein BH10ACI3_BH10ACI3_20650 [soil metagenome]
MKQTTTEIYIDVEETIYVHTAAAKNRAKVETTERDPTSTIEICPHCHQAIFEPKTIELKKEI